MKQEDLQKAIEAIGKSGIIVNGDLVLEKNVEYEVNNVEDGGIGIQFVNGKDVPVARTDKDIKASIEELLRAKNEKDEFIFQNKKQWWAVFRVLATFCNYPTKMTAFVKKINDLNLEYVREAIAITYDSLSGAPKDVPLMSCSPAAWDSLKDKSDNYKQQYDVADYLMQKLGIKS